MPGSDLYTGSLELLILKAVSWGPRHGYAIGRWLRQTTGEVFTVQEGACTRHCTGSSGDGCWRRNGASARPTARPSSIA